MIFTALMCEPDGEPIEYYTFNKLDLAFEKLLEISKFPIKPDIDVFKNFFLKNDDLYCLKQEYLNIEEYHRQLYILSDTHVRESIKEDTTVTISRIYDNELQQYKYFVMFDDYILYDSVYLDECEFYCDDREYDVIKDFDWI